MYRPAASFVIALLLGGSPVGCDSPTGSKSTASAGDDSSRAGSEPLTIEVPGLPGFVVPAGGAYRDMRHEREGSIKGTYEYPLKDFDRASLRKSVEANLTSAGWVVTELRGDFIVKKGAIEVLVLFGESSSHTMLSVGVPRTVEEAH